MLKLLFFDFPNIDKKLQNTLSVIISMYIACIWYNRENAVYLSQKFKAKLLKQQKLHKLMLNDNLNTYFSRNYCMIDSDIINEL